MATSTSNRSKNEIKAEIKALKKEKRHVKKKEKDPLYVEARKVLLNQVELDKDGNFITASERRFPLWGAADGEDRIRMFGVSNRTYYYDSEYNNSKAIFRAGKAMANIGRGINLRSDPKAVACLVKTYIFYPTVLVFYEDKENDDQLCLTAFTPRTYTSGLAIKLALKKFDKSAGEELERLGAEAGFFSKMREKHLKKKYGIVDEEEKDEEFDIELEDADDDYIDEPEAEDLDEENDSDDEYEPEEDFVEDVEEDDDVEEEE